MHLQVSMRLLLSLTILCWLQISLSAADLVKPRLEVYKAKRELLLFDGDRLIKTYPIALGSNPIPPKEREGDRATPEGAYFICQKNPQSQFRLSLAISYPGPLDAERGFKAGLITKEEEELILKASANHNSPPWNTKLGGQVFVHGNGSKPDWTWRCIALDDQDIDELYPLIPVGTPIVIHP
jgi:murein L,D-transpeptidase YafK